MTTILGGMRHLMLNRCALTRLLLETPDRISAPQSTPLRAIPAGERSRLVIQVTAIRDGTHWRQASGICQLTVNGHLLGVRPDDHLRIFGQLARPSPPLNPGEFDFAEHARADRQLARMRSSVPECVRVLQPGPTASIVSIVDATRNACKRLIWKFIGPDRAGLAAAILLGTREGLPYDQTEPYLVTGTIHVLVVSGMNVAILAAGLLGMMRVGWIARRAGLAIIIGVVVFYTLLAELQPPVVRAAVFGILLCVAAWTGRRGAAFNSLAAAALIVLFINPADLFRPGPQLSFLAVATLFSIGNQGGLVPAGPSKKRLDWLFAVDQAWYLKSLARWGRTIGWFGRPPDHLEQVIFDVRPKYVRMAIRCTSTIIWLIFASFAVWVATLPLVLLHFHVGSPISFLISPLVWLLIFVAMWSGFLMMTIGGLITPFGFVGGSICDWSLHRMDSLVAWANDIAWGHFWAPGPAWWWVLVFYLALLVMMIWGRRLAPPSWCVAAVCVWTLVGLAPRWFAPHHVMG